jgi:hypothetical protein
MGAGFIMAFGGLDVLMTLFRGFFADILPTRKKVQHEFSLGREFNFIGLASGSGSGMFWQRMPWRFGNDRFA